MHDQDALQRIEAVLLHADAPVGDDELLRVFPEATLARVQGWLEQLATRLDATQSAMQLVSSPMGWQLLIRQSLKPALDALWPERRVKLSNAVLETLAVIARQQPVTRADIEVIRGVSLNPNALKQLFELGWICERGTRPVPGKPALIYTTAQFLNDFQLPDLATLQAALDQAAATAHPPTPAREPATLRHLIDRLRPNSPSTSVDLSDSLTERPV